MAQPSGNPLNQYGIETTRNTTPIEDLAYQLRKRQEELARERKQEEQIAELWKEERRTGE